MFAFVVCFSYHDIIKKFYLQAFFVLLLSFVVLTFASVKTWNTTTGTRPREKQTHKTGPRERPLHPVWIFRPWIFRREFLISPHVNFHPWIFRTHGWIFILFLLRGFLPLNSCEPFRPVLVHWVHHHTGVFPVQSEGHDHALRVELHLFLCGVPIGYKYIIIAE